MGNEEELSNGRHGWVTAWSTVAYTILTAGLLFIAWQTYEHTFGRSHDQSFSVSVPVTDGHNFGRAKEIQLDFAVKRYSVEPKLVSCVMTVVSPRYDRQLVIVPSNTRLTDSDGDNFLLMGAVPNYVLERGQTVALKLQFAVNKDLVLPATITLSGYIDNRAFQHSFDIKQTSWPDSH